MVKENNKTQFTKRLQEACLDAGVAGRGLGKKIIDSLAKQGIRVSGPAVWKWLNAESIPDSTNILALSDWLNVRPEWLEYGRGAKNKSIDGTPLDQASYAYCANGVSSVDDEVEIPYYKSIELAAGYGSYANQTETDFCRTLKFSRSILNNYGILPSEAISFPVHGDSMSPVIPDGAIVTVSTGHKKIVDGAIYAIKQADLLRVKILRRLPNSKVIIKSYNSIDYPDEEANLDDIEIIGRVFNWSVMGW